MATAHALASRARSVSGVGAGLAPRGSARRSSAAVSARSLAGDGSGSVLETASTPLGGDARASGSRSPALAGDRSRSLGRVRGSMLRRRGGGDARCEAAGQSVLEREEEEEEEEKKKGLPEGHMEEMQRFLWKDLVHLFDEQGIDKSMYDQKVEFRDPITKYDTLNGFLINIAVLRTIFRPIFELHSVKQTGEYEITTRWTMTMNFWIVLWQPQLIFTGVSIMRVNPETGKFNAHIDRWDSIENNEYFSFEGAKDVIRQMQFFKQPDLETPKYKVRKRTAVYQVREYEPMVLVETECDSIAGSKNFNTVAGYIFGRNERGEKMQMTTPVFTETSGGAPSAKLQIVLPSSCKSSELPAPESEAVKIQQVDRRVAAALRFNGRPTLEAVEEKEKILERALRKDGLKMKGTFGLARYNDPGQTWPVFMKNEVLAWLEDFQLD